MTTNRWIQQEPRNQEMWQCPEQAQKPGMTNSKAKKQVLGRGASFVRLRCRPQICMDICMYKVTMDRLSFVA